MEVNKGNARVRGARYGPLAASTETMAGCPSSAAATSPGKVRDATR